MSEPAGQLFLHPEKERELFLGALAADSDLAGMLGELALPNSTLQAPPLEITVADPMGGKFKVSNAGLITYVGSGPANYPKVGTTWPKTHSNWATMIRNLSSASSANKAALDRVLGAAQVQQAVKAAPSTSAAARPVAQAAAQEDAAATAAALKEARKDRTLDLISSFSTGFQQLLPGRQAAPPMVYETIKETATEDEKASTPWGTYALIGGGVLLVGVAGFFAYRQLSKK